jgi:hypothetical protein
VNRIAQPEAFRLLETGVAVPEGDAQDLVEWGAVGFLFVLALLSFADARPRGFCESEYSEADELRLADFVDGLTLRIVDS